MATTPASVGVNQPVRMPPSRMPGISIGSAARRAAPPNCGRVERGRCSPAGPKK